MCVSVRARVRRCVRVVCVCVCVSVVCAACVCHVYVSLYVCHVRACRVCQCVCVCTGVFVLLASMYSDRKWVPDCRLSVHALITGLRLNSSVQLA